MDRQQQTNREEWVESLAHAYGKGIFDGFLLTMGAYALCKFAAWVLG